jgi:serine/threonine-protein kinase
MEGQGRGDGRVTGLHDPYTGAVIAEHYKVIELIARGGMGIVYRGRNDKTGSRVAIKFMHRHLVGDATLAERFLQEVKTAGHIEHPHVARILDWGRVSDDGVLFIISEYLAGKTLEETIGEPPQPLSLQRVRKVGLGILEALVAAHEKSVVHRDLKPANVFLVRQGATTDFVKVIDFGIAKILTNGGGKRLKLTRPGEVFGTPLYMSPEQCLGNKPVGPWSDLYAVGVILYEMATGRTPFTGLDEEGNELSLTSVMTLHVSGEVPRPSRFNPQIPEALEEVILNALRKNHSERFSSAAEFAKALSTAIPYDPTEDEQRFSVTSLEEAAADGYAGPMEEAPTSPSHDSLPEPRAPRLLPVVEGSGRPAAPPPDVATAPTVTPTRVSREDRRAMRAAARRAAQTPSSSKRSPTVSKSAPAPTDEEAATPGPETTADSPAAEEATKLSEVRTGEIPKGAKIAIICAIALGALTILSLLLLSNGKESRGGRTDVLAAASPDALPEATSREATETEAQTARQPDATVTQPPAPASSPDAEAAEVEAAEAELPDAPTVLPATEPPARYRELLAQGQRAQKESDYRQATRLFREAIGVWPEGPDAWKALGNVLLLQRGKTREACAAFQRCLELLPQTAHTHAEREVVEGNRQGLRCHELQ